MSDGRKRLFILVGLSAAVAVLLLVATLAVTDDDGDDDGDETATASATTDATGTETATSTGTAEETQTEDPSDGGETDTLQLVNDVASMLEAGDYDGLMAMAVPQTLDCRPIEGSWPLCEGLPLDAEVQGFRITQHGSEGLQVDEGGLRSEFEQSNVRDAERASYGCAVDLPDCDGLLVVFQEEPLVTASETLTRVFYIVLVEGDIVGAGKSGDNAEDFLREGEAYSQLGTAEITLLP
jgi:hypothetical protein